MTPSSDPVESKNSQGAKAPVPPDEEFWQRYSPHHEFPLSTVSSIAIHILAVVLLLVGGWLLWKLGLTEDGRSLPVEAIVFDAGGGGSRTGVGTGPGDGDPVLGKSDPTQPEPDPKKPVPSTPEIKDIDTTAFDPVQLPKLTDSTGNRVVPDVTQALTNLASVNQDARKKMFNGLAAGKGKGGSGSGGGEGSGTGTGTGAGAGEGKGKLNQRQKRVLRWTMVFNTADGSDYVRQLQGLGAMLAYPDPSNPAQYLLIEDLRQPRGKVDDLSKINRIFWVDDNPQSVRSLSTALGLTGVQHFVAFFPESLEAQLLKLELAYRGVPEERIAETRFEVRRAGAGYEPYVVSQR